MEWSSNPAAGKNTKLERVSQKKLNSRRLQKYSGGKFGRQDSVLSEQDPWSCPPEVALGGLHGKGQHDGEVANRLEQSLRQAACPSPPAGRELGTWRRSHPTANEAGGKRGQIVEAIPSPDDRESLCSDMSVAGTNKPRCPGRWDMARGRTGVTEATDRWPSSGARVRVSTARGLGASQEMSQGRAFSSPLGRRHKTDPGEELGGRT